MSHFEHGALDKATRHLVDPKGALKRTWYECPDCHRDVSVRKGEVRAPYFAHRADRENPCTYYNRNPSSEQKHRNAQLKLKQFLERGKEIDIGRICPCGCRRVTNWGITCLPSNTVKCEHRFKFNDSNKSADVAVLNSNGDIICIFEVVHTHYTREFDRPEPWHEIMADEINAIPSDSETVTLTCVRQVERDVCSAKRAADRAVWLKRQEEARARWEFERPQREEEQRRRDEYREEMASRRETWIQLRREEEAERQKKLIEEEQVRRARIQEQRKKELEHQKALEERATQAEEALKKQKKLLFRKHSEVVPRCEQCGPIAAWLKTTSSVGRCHECKKKIYVHVHTEMKPPSHSHPLTS